MPGTDAPARSTISLRDRVGALLTRMNDGRLYDEARTREFPTLSAFLEAEDPSDGPERAQGHDAFTRMMALAQIRTASDRWGSYHAHTLARFKEGDDEATADARTALFPEWCRRQWQGGAMRGRLAEQQRAQTAFLSADFISGSIQRPYDDDTTLRMMEMEPAVPLPEVIARVRQNDGQDYRSRYLTEPAAGDIRMLRVAELTELPRAKITEGGRVIRLLKFGRSLEASYEALRRLPIDDFAVYIRKLRIQTEVDQVGAALDVGINGDGNAGTAATSYALTTLDPATTANNLTILGWLGFKLSWANPYGITHVFGRQAAILKLLSLNLGTANVMATTQGAPASLRQEFVPINTRLTDGVRYGITNDVPANKLVGIDGRFGIEHVQERGSDISEVEKWITRQAEVLTFSFNEGFATFDSNAVKILDLAS